MKDVFTQKVVHRIVPLQATSDNILLIILTPRCPSYTVEFLICIIEYLGETETNFENILPFLSRACRLGRILKIIEVENLVTHSL